MAKRNKAAGFHAHRSIFTELAHGLVSRQRGRAVWHQLFKGVPVGDLRLERCYRQATGILAAQMREQVAEREERAA